MKVITEEYCQLFDFSKMRVKDFDILENDDIFIPNRTITIYDFLEDDCGLMIKGKFLENEIDEEFEYDPEVNYIINIKEIFFGINTVDFCSDDKCVVLFLDKQSKEFFQDFKKRLKMKRARNKLKSK